MAVDHPADDRIRIRNSKFELRAKRLSIHRADRRFIYRETLKYCRHASPLCDSRRGFRFYYSFMFFVLFIVGLFNIRVRAPLVSWGVERRHQSLSEWASKRIWAIYWDVDRIVNLVFYFFYMII